MPSSTVSGTSSLNAFSISCLIIGCIFSNSLFVHQTLVHHEPAAFYFFSVTSFLWMLIMAILIMSAALPCIGR
jgi:hypothetical protein